jgi:hypothetical protein
LEGLREHLLPGGSGAQKQEVSASILAEDGTEGSCVLVPVEADFMERGKGFVVTRAALVKPDKPFVSFLAGGDFKIISDLAEQKRGVFGWRVNGHVFGDEHVNATRSMDPRPTRSLLEKMQVEASRPSKRQPLVRFVEDENSVQLPVNQQKLVAEMFPNQEEEADEKKAANDLELAALLSYRADEEEEGEVRSTKRGAVEDNSDEEEEQERKKVQEAALEEERLRKEQERKEQERENLLKEIPTLTLRGVSASAVSQSEVERLFARSRPAKVREDGKRWLIEYESLMDRDTAIREMGGSV